MRIDGKEILNDEELQAIIDKRHFDAVSMIRYRLGLDLRDAAHVVGKTMIELGIAIACDSALGAVYKDDYQP
jgi:uncharacterized membrane protein